MSYYCIAIDVYMFSYVMNKNMSFVKYYFVLPSDNNTVTPK